MVVIFCATLCSCVEKPAPEKEEGKTSSAVAGKSGSELFKETALGTSGKSCNSCHPDGEGLKGIGNRLKGEKELEEIINKCIVGPLKGKELDHASPEMTALVKYLRSL